MRLTYLSLFLSLTLRLGAAIPPAAQLLPTDTLVLVSLPEWDKAAEAWPASVYGKLWEDPALKPFKDKLMQRWTEDLAAPLERDLGIKLSDFMGLIHGQVALVVTQNGWGTRPEAQPGIVLLLDSKGKQDQLKARLDDLKKKLAAAGKQLKTDKIRDVEFTTLILSDEELNKALEKAFPGSKDDMAAEDADAKPETSKKESKAQITFGQSGSLLLVSNNSKDLEAILARQAGAALGPSLAEQEAYEFNQNALFRDALGFAWVNFSRIYEVFQKQMNGSGTGQDNSFAPRPDKLIGALGLNGIRTVAARLSNGPEGIALEAFARAPESKRQGLLRLIALEQRDSGPPPFVGSDVVKFKRWRIDGQKAWAALEKTLTTISPEIAGLLQMGFQAAGKDNNPDFDLRKTLVGNLGNDFVSVQKSARKAAALPDLESAPSLFLIGSAHSDQLVEGIKAATSLLPLAGGAAELKEREFLGRKIYSISFPTGPGAEDPKVPVPTRDFSFAATGGYAAMSTDAPTLETYLRSGETQSKPLRELAGLNEAAQHVGGMNTGFFAYENQSETVKAWLDSAKRESAALDKLLSLAPLPAGKEGSADERKNVKQWVDVSLLPPFDRISKYFSFIVYSLGSSQEGLSWKAFAPTPPQVK